MPFRGHVSRLCTRAGKTGWALRGRVNRNTFPDWLRSKVDFTPTEEAFWTNVTSAVNTAIVDRMDAKRADHAERNGDKDRDFRDYKDTKVSKDGDSRDSKDSRDRDSKNHNDRDRRDRDNRKDKHKCVFCWYLGHELGDCRKMKAATVAQQQQQPPRQSRNQNQSLSGIVCYNCQKPGHISPPCPEPKRLTSAPANDANPAPPTSDSSRRSNVSHYTDAADVNL